MMTNTSQVYEDPSVVIDSYRHTLTDAIGCIESYKEKLAAAQAQRDKLVEALKLIEDHHNETEEWRNIAHEALKECGK